MDNFCRLLCLAVIMYGFFTNIDGYTGEDSTNLLQWAPITLKTPYLTFINNFYYASWKTRNSITKEEESLRYLKLPRGVPFSVACGACFQPSNAQTNLTISVTGHNYHSVPKMRRQKIRQYRVGFLTCIISYALTAPIHTSGQIKCTLKRGRQEKNEVISFGVVDVNVDEVPEELESQNDAEEINLHCPIPDEPLSFTNPLIHVWHQDPPAADPGPSILPQLAPSISLRRPSHTKRVVCSVYNIGNPSKVYRARYRILGSQAMKRHEYQLSNDLLEYDEDAEMLESDNKKLSGTLVGIIIAATVICALIIIMGLYQFIGAARKK